MIKSAIKKIATNPILLKVLNAYERKFSQGKVKVLLYHRVSPANSKWSLKAIHPRDFEEQIKFVKENYTIIPLNKLKEYTSEIDKSKQKKYAVITFDDGYKDNYLYAYPILKKYDVPATFFITSGLIGTGQLFWWDRVGYAIYHTKQTQIRIQEFGVFQLDCENNRINAVKQINLQLKQVEEEVKNKIIDLIWEQCKLLKHIEVEDNTTMSWNDIFEMKANGYDFGAHTIDHPILTNLPYEELKRQIKDSKNIMERKLNTKINTFAYPNGTPKDYDQLTINLLRQVGFEYAVTTIAGFNNNGSDCYQLKRVDCGADLKVLQLKISSLYCKLEDIKSYVYRRFYGRALLFHEQWRGLKCD